MRALILAAAAGSLAMAASANAKPLQTEQFKANAAIQIDPAKAYLLVRSPGLDLKLLKLPSEAEQKEYAAERGAALAKAKEKYPRQLKAYNYEMENWKSLAERGMKMALPEKPIEPTDENFAFKAIESDNFATIWGGRVFDKAGPRTVHLIAVPPGTYRIYGQIFSAPNGASAVGTCMCMGSVQFDAAAGTITDMGAMRYPVQEAKAEKVDPSWNGLTPGRGGLTSMRVEPADVSTYVPERISSLPRVQATYRAAGKVDNFFGVMVDRLTPMPGVLSYKRDEVIDDKEGAAIASN